MRQPKKVFDPDKLKISLITNVDVGDSGIKLEYKGEGEALMPLSLWLDLIYTALTEETNLRILVTQKEFILKECIIYSQYVPYEDEDGTFHIPEKFQINKRFKNKFFDRDSIFANIPDGSTHARSDFNKGRFVNDFYFQAKVAGEKLRDLLINLGHSI